MKSLVITGNGFDVAHKLPTRYSDFMDYVWNVDREFYEQLIKYIFEDDLWNDFENALGFLEAGEIKAMSDAAYLNYEGRYNDSQQAIIEELEFSTRISEILKEWIQSINTNVEPVVSDKIIDNGNIFINFNYTDTLETVYNILEENICYIHGKGTRSERLIIGHHNIFAYGAMPLMLTYQEMDEWIKYERNKSYEEKEKEFAIDSYFTNTYKDTDAIIVNHRKIFERLEEVEAVYVLGHSLSHVDFTYFQRICSCVSPECVWYITYYSVKDKRNAQKMIDELEIKKYVIDTFEELCRK